MPEDVHAQPESVSGRPGDGDAAEPDLIEAAEERIGMLPGFGFFIGILIGLYGLWFILANNEPVQVSLFPLLPDVRTTVPVVVVVAAVVVFLLAGVISWRRRRRGLAGRSGGSNE